MRHRPELTPTARLCILIADREKRPLGYKDFIHLTGCSLAALQLTLPPLVRAGRFVRNEGNGMCTFSLPAPAPGVGYLPTPGAPTESSDAG